LRNRDTRSLVFEREPLLQMRRFELDRNLYGPQRQFRATRLSARNSNTLSRFGRHHDSLGRPKVEHQLPQHQAPSRTRVPPLRNTE
jgi:hypothetical protein